MVEERKLRRQELAGEHAMTDIGQLLLFGVFLAVWITDSFVFRYSTFAGAHVPLYVRLPVGLAALVVAALLALSAHEAVFGRAARGRGTGGGARSPGLITGGPFAFVRHPMYAGSWLFSAGLAVATLSLASAGVSAVILLFYWWVARHEERILSEKFGEEYWRYRARVGMFFPRRPGRGHAAVAGPQERPRQRYQAVPGPAGITSTSENTSPSSLRPARRKRR
jgi:protein-S-isoprenylcysteine O-methyltransferase Ste14